MDSPGSSLPSSPGSLSSDSASPCESSCSSGSCVGVPVASERPGGCVLGPGVGVHLHSLPRRKLFVGGLPFHTSSATLKEHFDRYGPIDEAVVIADRTSTKSKGYGFVILHRVEDAERACAEQHPMIDGRKANVNLAILGAKPKKHRLPRRGIVNPKLILPHPAPLAHGTEPLQQWYIQMPQYTAHLPTLAAPPMGTVFYDYPLQGAPGVVPPQQSSPPPPQSTHQHQQQCQPFAGGLNIDPNAMGSGAANGRVMPTVYLPPGQLPPNYPMVTNPLGSVLMMSPTTRVPVPYMS